MKRRHRGVLFGSILGIAVSVALAMATTTLTGFEPGALGLMLFLAVPFLLGLAPLVFGMPLISARLIWMAAGIIAIPIGLLLLWTGAFVVYIPMALVYFHAVATMAHVKDAVAST